MEHAERFKRNPAGMIFAAQTDIKRAADAATVCIKGKLFIGPCSLVLPMFDPEGNQFEEQWKVVD